MHTDLNIPVGFVREIAAVRSKNDFLGSLRFCIAFILLR